MFCSVEVLTGETCREECRAESKIEKAVSVVTNSVVKSLIEFSTIAESDLPKPSIKANAIMMVIRYLMKFLTLIKWGFLYAFCNILSHDKFVCKYSAFFWICRCFFNLFSSVIANISSCSTHFLTVYYPIARCKQPISKKTATINTPLSVCIHSFDFTQIIHKK